MVEELREAIEQVERQPAEIQRRIAQPITEELEEREWDALVSSATSQQFLAHLSAGIDAQSDGLLASFSGRKRTQGE